MLPCDGRRVWYLNPAEIQRDLDRFLKRYNFKRTQGYRVRGRNQAFVAGLSPAVETPDRASDNYHASRSTLMSSGES